MMRTHPRILLILDDAPYHRSETVTEFVKDNEDRLRPVFLPAYTPQLNLIEQQWNVLKRMMLAGRYFASVEDPKAAIAAIARRRRMHPVGMMNYPVAAQ